MTTKDYGLSFKKMGWKNAENDVKTNQKIFNQNHRPSIQASFQSKRLKKDIRKSLNYDFPDNLQSKSEFSSLWNKTTKNSDSFNLVIHDSDKKKKIQDQTTNSKSTVNNSTLSLHIAAYENSIIDSEIFGENSIKKVEHAKQFAPPAKSINQNPFEFPRQQENKTRESGISQFKASQRLFNPKKSYHHLPPQHGIFTHIVQQNQTCDNFSSLGFGASNDNVFGSERALLERFKIPNMDDEQNEKFGSDLRTKKFIIELLHLHWYHETNRMVVAESRLSNGYKLANELKAQNDLKARQFLETSRRQSKKIIDLQNQLEIERRKYRMLENQYKLIKPDAPKIQNPVVDISGLNGLFSISLLNSPVDDNTPCYKTCAFGELDEGGPIFDERDESLRPHFGGGWSHPQISPLIDEPINERRRITKLDTETISNTGVNYDAMLNCSTATAAAELEHPAAKIGRKHI